MHELSVAESILDIVQQHVAESRAGDIRAVTVRLGELSGVVENSLVFCFDAIVADTPYQRSRLAIERVPARGRCAACGQESIVQVPVFLCPSCGEARIALTSGQELQVVSVELEEPATNTP